MERVSPELWFRRSTTVSAEMLLALIYKGDLTATIRLGARHERHFKGYAVGEDVVIRVKDAADNDMIVRQARVTDIVIKRLCLLTDEELADTLFYKSWREVLHDLMFFEKKPVTADPMATLVRFEYTFEARELDPDDPRIKFPALFFRYQHD